MQSRNSHLIWIKAATLVALTCMLGLWGCVQTTALDEVIQTNEPRLPTLTQDAISSGEDTSAPGGPVCTSNEECASNLCAPTHSGNQCAVGCIELGVCEDGTECFAHKDKDKAFCLDPRAMMCSPCQKDIDCQPMSAQGFLGSDSGNKCVQVGDIKACLVSCKSNPDICNSNEVCDGDVCRPLDDTCLCSAGAVEQKASTPCQCRGQRTCVEEGQAPTVCERFPSTEICNGIDDDCDGVPDNVGTECGAYACGGTEGCLTRCTQDRDCAKGLGCDYSDVNGNGRKDECIRTGRDGNACDIGPDCLSGYCGGGFCCSKDSSDNPLCCSDDSDCASLNSEPDCLSATASGCHGIQQVGTCENYQCVLKVIETPQACEGRQCRSWECIEVQGQLWLDGQHICESDGRCLPTADVKCETSLCHQASCDTGECLKVPYTGRSNDTCYTGLRGTAGVGVCREGIWRCEDGVATDCIDQQLPSTEVCDGTDQDCDGEPDNGPVCGAYACNGSQGCLASCDTVLDCGEGYFCKLPESPISPDQRGHCEPSGEIGSPCVDADGCQSGHCSNGYCCEEGLCCRDSSDCTSLTGDVCRDPNLCLGVHLEGHCGPQFQCLTTESPSPTACLSQICEGLHCEGTLSQAPSVCDHQAQCIPGDLRSCKAYTCNTATGDCFTNCRTAADCMPAASCVNGLCQGVPDGGECTLDTECASGHCGNGYCCREGNCCNEDAHCEFLNQTAVCLDSQGCIGSQVVGLCSNAHTCTTLTRSAPEACAGESCGASECVNLSGLGLVKEGIKVKECSAAGVCEETSLRCGENTSTYSTCQPRSENFGLCQRCESGAACIVWGSPCYCEDL